MIDARHGLVVHGELLMVSNQGFSCLDYSSMA